MLIGWERTRVGQENGPRVKCVHPGFTAPQGFGRFQKVKFKICLQTSLSLLFPMAIIQSICVKKSLDNTQLTYWPLSFKARQGSPVDNRPFTD